MIKKLCECGCGGLAPIATKTNSAQGHIKGKAMRFIQWHKKKKSIGPRFWNKVNKEGPLPSAEAIAAHPDIAGTSCWVWKAATTNGYGIFGIWPRNYVAHKVAWYLTYGTWPKPFALHKCDNRSCVRPTHLFEGTQLDNSQDMVSKGRCKPGTKFGDGEKHFNAKLTAKQVQRIRKLYSQGKSQRLLAEQFEVSKSNIKHIVRHKSWKTI